MCQLSLTPPSYTEIRVNLEAPLRFRLPLPSAALSRFEQLTSLSSAFQGQISSDSLLWGYTEFTLLVG